MSAESSAVDERHLQRRRTIIRTALSGFGAKATMFLPTLGIAKVAVPVIGTERFGVLMTILSLVAFLGVADLGVGSSLVTLISRAVGSNDYARVRRLQANGIIAVSGLAVILFLTAAAVRYTHVGGMMFPLSDARVQREGTLALSAFGMCFALSLPLTLVGKIQLGLQRGDVANYWQIAAALGNFGAASAATIAGLSIPWITAGMLSGTIICAALNMATHYVRQPLVRPSLTDVSRAEIRRLLADSLFYLALQLIFLVAYSADTMIVARVLGAQRASVYALSERLFSMVAVAVGLVTSPLWAAYGEALGAGDAGWVKATLRISTIRIVAAAVVASAGILLVLRPAVVILSSGRLAVPISLGLAMASWRVIEAVGSSLSVYLFASQAVRFVLITGGINAVISLIAKVTILHHANMYAIPVTMGISFALLCLLPDACYLHRTLRSSRALKAIHIVS